MGPLQEWLAREDGSGEEKPGAPASGVPCLYTRTASLEQIFLYYFPR